MERTMSLFSYTEPAIGIYRLYLFGSDIMLVLLPDITET